MVLYAPLSAFENATIVAYKAGRPIAAPKQGDIPEYKTPEYRRKRPRPDDPDGSTADSAGSYRPRLASLDNNWYLNYASVTELFPPASAVQPIRKLYSDVAESAAQQIGAGVEASNNLAFSSGPLSLQLSSKDPINWTFVLNFVYDMMDKLSANFAPLFGAEAVNAVWELEPVRISLSLLTP